MEDFYSQYGYEPDEQPLHTQNCSTVKINKQNINTWLNTLFNNKSKNNDKNITINY